MKEDKDLFKPKKGGGGLHIARIEKHKQQEEAGSRRCKKLPTPRTPKEFSTGCSCPGNDACMVKF